MAKANKKKRGKFLQDWLIKLTQKDGLSKEMALERIENHLTDPIKLRIINALVGE